jgi:hypothetical protein
MNYIENYQLFKMKYTNEYLKTKQLNLTKAKHQKLIYKKKLKWQNLT